MLSKPPLLLAIECATPACSVALYVQGEIVERFERTATHHAERILFLLDDLLKSTSTKIEALSAIAVGIGPGSFIGVRTAIGVAQGLSFAYKLPVIPVSTLQVVAQTAHAINPSIQEVLVAWDARMAALYAGHYRLDAEGLMQAVTPDGLQKPHAWSLPPEMDSNRCYRVGNAWAVYEQDLRPLYPVDAALLLPTLFPHASALLPIALAYYAQGKSIPVQSLEPCYIRQEVAHLLNVRN